MPACIKYDVVNNVINLLNRHTANRLFIVADSLHCYCITYVEFDVRQILHKKYHLCFERVTKQLFTITSSCIITTASSISSPVQRHDCLHSRHYVIHPSTVPSKANCFMLTEMSTPHYYVDHQMYTIAVSIANSICLPSTSRNLVWTLRPNRCEDMCLQWTNRMHASVATLSVGVRRSLSIYTLPRDTVGFNDECHFT